MLPIIQYTTSITLELISFILFAVRTPVDLPYYDPKPKEINRGGTPILLVHGYLQTSASWLYFRHCFSKARIGPVYTINLGSPFHSIEEYAEKVRKKANQIAYETNRRDLVLIGHSMGGLVSAYYATHLAPDETVVSVITIGSPLHGTKIAQLGFGHAAKQMHYQSPFTMNLRQKMMESQVPFLHIGSQTDLIIQPTYSAFVHSPHSNSYEFKVHGHFYYLYSNAVFDKILAFLHPFDGFDSENTQTLFKGTCDCFTKQ